MTREEMIAKMTGFKAEAETKVAAYNLAISESNNEGAEDSLKDAENAVKEYNKLATSIAFENARNSGDAMLYACKNLVYNVIRIADVATDAAIPPKSVEDKAKSYDLVKLNKFVKDSPAPAPDYIGKSAAWIDAAHNMNYLLTIRVAEELGIDPKSIRDDYKITELAKKYADASGKQYKVSNKEMLRTLQNVINLMVGEDYKATSHDVNYLYHIYTRKGRGALSVAVANHGKFIGYLQEVCYKLINDLVYSVDYKKIK